MADSSKDTLFREVDEELRREQLAKLWENYGTYFLAGAVLIVAGVGGWKWWEARQISAANQAGARYEAAARLVESGKPEEAHRGFEALAADGPRGYQTLARLRLAGADAKSGKVADALAAYDALGRESGVDPLLRDFARLRAASLKLGSADWTEMQNRLNDLAAEQSPWRFSARELLGLAAYRAGNLDEARRTFELLLADAKGPASINERARIAMSMIVAAELARAPPAAETPKAAGPDVMAPKAEPRTAEPKPAEPKKK